MQPASDSPDQDAPANPAQPPASPGDKAKPREIPREKLDHEPPTDPDPDDPASP